MAKKRRWVLPLCLFLVGLAGGASLLYALQTFGLVPQAPGVNSGKPGSGYVCLRVDEDFAVDGNQSQAICGMLIVGFQVDQWAWDTIRQNGISTVAQWDAYCDAHAVPADHNMSYAGLVEFGVGSRAAMGDYDFENVSIDGNTAMNCTPVGCIFVPVAIYLDLIYENGTYFDDTYVAMNDSIGIFEQLACICFANASQCVVKNGDTLNVKAMSVLTAPGPLGKDYDVDLIVNAMTCTLSGF